MGSGTALAREDRRAAAFLIGILLAYGLLMLWLSKASLIELAEVTREYVSLSLNGAVLAGCTYGAVCLVRPEERRTVLDRLLWLGVACVMVGLLFPFFGMFKQLILPTRGFLWDRTLAHLGRLMFGVSPWTLAHHVFGTVAGTVFLDRLYSGWMALMVAMPFATSILFTDRRKRFQILIAWLLAWILIGSLAAWSFASAGPCYFNAFVGPDADYARLLRHLAVLGKEAAAAGHPIASLQFQPELQQTFDGHELRLAGGISAMPSMHVALATLMTFAAFQKSRAAGWLFAVYTALVWVGSVFFGWHYIVDGPIAVIMMILVWRLSRRLSEHFYGPVVP